MAYITSGILGFISAIGLLRVFHIQWLMRPHGRMVQKNPFSFYGLMWGIFNFFYLFFQTLTNANFNKYGDEYGKDMRRPGGGPPKPPSQRFGGFSSGSGPAPPPSGGCGCG